MGALNSEKWQNEIGTIFGAFGRGGGVTLPIWLSGVNSLPHHIDHTQSIGAEKQIIQLIIYLLKLVQNNLKMES